MTADRVIAEAQSLADEVGLEAMTLAAVAQRLGVRQPSLYKHVAGMDDLRRSLSIRAKRELADVLGRATVGRARDEAVSLLCTSYRQWALSHPGRYSATLRAPDPGDETDRAASAAVVSIVTDVLAGYGLVGEPAIHATRALRAALHGFVSLEASGGFGMPVDVDVSFERLVALVVAGLAGGAGGPGARP